MLHHMWAPHSHPAETCFLEDEPLPSIAVWCTFWEENMKHNFFALLGPYSEPYRFKEKIIDIRINKDFFLQKSAQSYLSKCMNGSVLHQDEGGIGKSIPDAMPKSPREILRVEGNLEGRGDRFPNTSRVLVEDGHSLIINFSTGSGSGNPSLWTGKD